MGKSSHPYRRLIDQGVALESPVSVGGLRRTVTAALLVGLVAVVVLIGVLGCLVALSLSGLTGPAPAAALGDGYRGDAAPGLGSSPTASDAESPGLIGPLLDRLSAMEREVATLKALCRRLPDTLPDGGREVKQPSGQDRPHLSSSTVANVEVMQEQAFAGGIPESDPPNSVPVDGKTKNLDSSVGHGSLPASPQDPASPSTRPRPQTVVDADDGASPGGSGTQHRRRPPRSKDRHRVRPRDRDEPAGEPARFPAVDGDAGPDDERGGAGQEAEQRRGKKKDRAGRNSGRDQRMSESSSGRLGDDRDSRCRHCIDNDKVMHDGNERTVGDDTSSDDHHPASSVFGQATHIQGNRDGNIRIENDGWIRGFGTWKMADVMEDAGQYFSLSPLGVVTVEESGVYYVYSQILFYDPNDTVGQSIYINDAPRFTCTKSNISAEAKQSTCYVGGVVRMSAGDTVGIKLSVHDVTIALYADTSYFGLFRVA